MLTIFGEYKNINILFASMKSGNKSINPEQEIIYEEIDDTNPHFMQHPNNGAVPPFVNGFPPPPPQPYYMPFPPEVIVEEIIEEYVEEDDGEYVEEIEVEQDASKIAVQPSLSEQPASQRQDTSPVQKPKLGKPVSKGKFVKNERFSNSVNLQKKLSLSGLFRKAKGCLLILFVLLTILGAAYYVSRDSDILKLVVSKETISSAVESSGITSWRLPRTSACNEIKDFYLKVTDSITAGSIKDIVLTGNVKFTEKENAENFYCIRRYGDGAFLKIGAGDAERTYYAPFLGKEVYLLEEGRISGKKKPLKPQLAAVIRALTEFDDSVYPFVFQSNDSQFVNLPTFDEVEVNFAGGAKVGGVNISMDGRPISTLFFNPKTRLIKGIRVYEGNSSADVAFDSYKKIDEICEIPTSRTVYVDGKIVVEVNVIYSSVNRGLFFPM